MTYLAVDDLQSETGAPPERYGSFNLYPPYLGLLSSVWRSMFSTVAALRTGS